MKNNIFKLTSSAILIGSLVTVSANSWAGNDHEYGTNYCSKTTRAAFIACKEDLSDNFWESKGICINISDDDERAECFTDARVEKKESKQLCREQREARNEVCEAIGESRFDPQIDPADFVNPLEIGDSISANTYMPLLKGFTRIYEAGDETVTVTVTDETVEIMGVTCIVVRDTVSENGELIEDTDDWFAQDIHGNVWYFGEISRNYEDGLLENLDGSWMAGRDGAKAGIVMQAVPESGQVYRQEWALAEAEDMGEVLSVSATESSLAVSCNGDCLQTHDFTPLEPGVNENKFYAPGIGVIVAFDVEEPEDREELVEYHY